jgi:hypothetical protein
MRSLLIGLVAIIIATFASTASMAAPHREAKNIDKYDGCVCHFGYGSAGCGPTAACNSEHGQCGEACFVKNAQDFSRRLVKQPRARDAI